MPRNRIIMFHTLHAQLFEIELLNMGRKHSGTGVIPAQAAVLRDIEIGAELKPHIPEIHTRFDSLISCHPVIAVRVLPYLIEVSMRVVCYDSIKLLLKLYYLASSNLNVRRLTLSTT